MITETYSTGKLLPNFVAAFAAAS